MSTYVKWYRNIEVKLYFFSDFLAAFGQVLNPVANAENEMDSISPATGISESLRRIFCCVSCFSFRMKFPVQS